MNSPSKRINSLKQSLHHWVWDVELNQVSRPRARLIKTARVLVSIARDLFNGSLSLRAMSLVYTTIISLVPLLALSFSVLKGFGAHTQMLPMLLNALEPLGDKRFELANRIIEFVDNIKVGVLGALGLGLLIYTVISMMQKIENSFNYIWRISRGRNLAQKFSDYLSVILVGPFLIFISVGLTASIRSHAVVEYLTSMPFLGTILEVLGLLVPYLIMASAFAFIYVFVPNTRVKLTSALIGGLVTAVAWKTMGWLFAEFLANSSSQTAIYSAFASIFIFMLWLYLGWLILLVGASITYYHQNPQYLTADIKHLKLSNSAREELGLHIMYFLGRAFEHNQTPWSTARLQTQLQLPNKFIEDQLQDFLDAKLIVATDDNPPRFVPARPLDHIKIDELLALIRTPKKLASSQHQLRGKVPGVTTVIADYEQAMKAQTAQLSLRDLVKD